MKEPSTDQVVMTRWLTPVGSTLFLAGLGMLGWTLLGQTAHMSICGGLITLSGVITCACALFFPHRDLFWLNLFRGTLYAVLGFMMVSRPQQAAEAIGMLASAFLLVEGIFEVVPFAVLGFQKRLFRTMIGVYCFGMGVLIWASASNVALWFVSLSLSIDIILNACLICFVSISGGLPSDGGWSVLMGKVTSDPEQEQGPPVENINGRIIPAPYTSGQKARGLKTTAASR